VLGHESARRVIDPGLSTSQKGDLVAGLVAVRTRFPALIVLWASRICAVTASTRGVGSRDRRIHVRTLAHRTRICHQGGSVLGILGVLLEPTTVITKALEQVMGWDNAHSGNEDRAGDRSRSNWSLAAGVVRLSGRECMFSIVPKRTKPELVRAIGATYHSGSVLDIGFEPDVIVECTGVGSVIVDSIQKIAAGGVLCVTGVGAGGLATVAVADVASGSVLKNNVVVGSVNANKRHWYKQ